MLFYYLKCRKNTESKNPEFVKTRLKELWFHQSVQLVVVKNKIY